MTPSHKGNANKSHSEVPCHFRQNGYNHKITNTNEKGGFLYIASKKTNSVIHKTIKKNLKKVKNICITSPMK